MDYPVASRMSTSLGVIFLSLATLPLTSQAVVSVRSALYSVGAEDRFCSVAQQTVAATTLSSLNIIHTDLNTFVNSSPGPYNGANTGGYNGTIAIYPTGNTLAVGTQQFVSNRELGATGWEYPTVISCKMKTSEALNYFFGAGSAGTQQTCKEINKKTVADVYSSLTAIERRTLRWAESTIVFPNDGVSLSGPSWVYPLPYLPKVAFIGADNFLRIRGLSLTVSLTDTSAIVLYDKKGVTYCHLPSPEYVRALITGQTNPILETPPAD